jgi:uncharacterized membrane protein YccC
MGGFFKALVFAGCLALAFYAGYWLGDHRLDDVTAHVKSLQSELGKKTAAIDREMVALKRRETLAQAREALARAREALANKNFGDAEEEIRLAAERIGSLVRDAAANTKAGLTSVRDALEELRKKVRSSQQGVQEQLRRLGRRIDDLARQWE